MRLEPLLVFCQPTDLLSKDDLSFYTLSQVDNPTLIHFNKTLISPKPWPLIQLISYCEILNLMEKGSETMNLRQSSSVLFKVKTVPCRDWVCIT